MHIPLQYIDDWTLDDFYGIIGEYETFLKKEAGGACIRKPTSLELEISRRLGKNVIKNA